MVVSTGSPEVPDSLSGAVVDVVVGSSGSVVEVDGEVVIGSLSESSAVALDSVALVLGFSSSPSGQPVRLRTRAQSGRRATLCWNFMAQSSKQ